MLTKGSLFRMTKLTTDRGRLTWRLASLSLRLRAVRILWTSQSRSSLDRSLMPACRSLCRQFSRNSCNINTDYCVISFHAIKILKRSKGTLAWRRISSLMLSAVSGRAGMVAMLDQRRGRTTGFSTTSPKSSLTCVKNTYRTRFPIWRKGDRTGYKVHQEQFVSHPSDFTSNSEPSSISVKNTWTITNWT